MRLENEKMRLYAVTDHAWSTSEYPFENQIEDALKSGVTFLQLREKNISDDEYIEIASRIKKLTDKYNVPFVINDNINVAVAVNADGVHLGQNDTNIMTARKILGKNKIIGASARTPQQAIQAYNDGADYLGTGAVFGTSTKKDARNITIEQLSSVCHSVNIPVVAIGGVNDKNMLQLKNSGIAGVAVVSAIFAQKDILSAVKNLKAIADIICEKDTD
jgi:thiamine-phosphate pyrophosphorylase